MKRSVIEKIRELATITQACQWYGIELTQHGDRWQGPCPFHDSKGKTAFISYDNRGFKCFGGCGEGDIFTFIELAEQCTFNEAIYTLAGRLDIPIELSEQEIQTHKRLRDEQQIITSIHEAFAHSCEEQMRHYTIDGKDIYTFEMEKRGFSAQTMRNHRIGFAPNGDIITKKLMERFASEDLLKTGLFIPIGDGLQCIMQGRIIYPYFKKGKIVRFIGRKTIHTPDEEWEKGKYKKSMSPSENRPYISRVMENKYFYGEDTINGKPVLITEGITDAISLIQAGFSCISPVTIRFRKQDHDRLLELTKRCGAVYIINDNEDSKKGEEGALETAKFLFKHGIRDVNICTLKKSEDVEKIDVNEYLRDVAVDEQHGVVDNLIKYSQNILRILVANIDDQNITLRSQAVGEIAKLNIYSDAIYIDSVAGILQQEKQIPKGEFKKLVAKHRRELTTQMKIDDRQDERESVMMELAELRQKVMVNMTIGGVKVDEACELIVDELKKREYFYTVRDDTNEEMYVYKEGIYVPHGKTYIKEFCRKVLGELYTKKLTGKVIDKVLSDTYVDKDEFFNQYNPCQLPVSNGILNIDTQTLETFTPKKIFFNKIPITFDKTKTCPHIEQFFADVLKNESDVPLIQEITGHLLIKDYYIEKGVMFCGGGRNGKSKTFELFKTLLGPNNCANISITRLVTDPYAPGELLNKMVNLGSDIDGDDMRRMGIFKQLTGNDLISAQRKFLPMVHFKNYAKLMFAANDLPRISQDNEAIWRRWIYLEFPFTFIPADEYEQLKKTLSDDEMYGYKKQNRDIMDKLTKPDELSGFLNFALAGLQRLMQNKDFSYDKSSEEVRVLWLRKSNSFYAFFHDALVRDEDCKITKIELRKEYAAYCRKYKLKVASDRVIKNYMNEEGVDEAKVFDADNNRVRHWMGVRYRAKYRKVQEDQEDRGVSPPRVISESPYGSNMAGFSEKSDTSTSKKNSLRPGGQANCRPIDSDDTMLSRKDSKKTFFRDG